MLFSECRLMSGYGLAFNRRTLQADDGLRAILDMLGPHHEEIVIGG